MFEALPLQGSSNIKKLVWSPSGRYILIEAVVASYDSSKPTDGLMIVFEVSTQQIIAEIPHVRHGFFGQDDTLWIWSKNDWDVYAPPFHTKTSFMSGYGKTTQYPYDDNSWDFHPHTQTLSIAHYDEDNATWILSTWEKGAFAFAKTITPRNVGEYVGSRTPQLTFSPDGLQLAIVFHGWLAREQPGAEELWIIDIPSQTVELRHVGKIKWWQLFDSDTQRLAPSWTNDGTKVVYGDSTYGIEEFHLDTNRAHRLLPKNSDTYDITVSPSGSCVAFERWPGELDASGRYRRCMGVLISNEHKVLHLPEKVINWPYMWFAWHPHMNRLALIIKRRSDLETGKICDLYYWDVPETCATQSNL